MEVDVDRLDPNPFRSFERYPINQAQVGALKHSIHDLTFWGGVTARPHPENPRRYQIAAGHHRVEAVKQVIAEAEAAGDRGRVRALHRIDVCVETFTDEQMVQIMATENSTQGANLAAAALDSVGAAYEVISYALLGEPNLGKIFPRWRHLFESEKAVETARGQLLKERGIGWRLIQRFLPDGAMSEGSIRTALDTLKQGGDDASILARVRTRIDVEREAEAEAERARIEEARRREEEARAAAEAAERRRREAEEKAKCEAETRAAREAEARRLAEERRKAAKEKAEREAAEREERARKAAAEAERRAAEKAERARQVEARREEKAAEKTRVDAEEARRKAEEEAVATRVREAAKRAEEQAAQRERTLDPRVGATLEWSDHQIRCWNAAVSSETARKYLPVSEHLPLARAIMAHAKDLGRNPSGEWIADQVKLRVQEAVFVQREVFNKERDEKRRSDIREAVRAAHAELDKARGTITSATRKLDDLRTRWEQGNLGPFPYDGQTIDHLRRIRRAIDDLLESEKK